jgi:oxygen-independent coproporphyrinogen-3 oxidase
MSLPARGPEEFRAAIRRYSGPGPRYTSYPTVPAWSEDFGPAEFRGALASCSGERFSLYAHVPFCERLCAFCACNRTITQDHGVAGPYLDRIAREVERVADAMGGRPQQTQLAIGGGSPNFLRTDELARLCRILDDAFPPGSGTERSIELDPRRTEDEQVECLVELGFNRLSFGVQDLDPRVQEAIRRVSRPERLIELVGLARRLGIQSINFDLIYGLPEQTLASFQETLTRVLELRPERIALYGYAHVTWISKAQRGFEKKDLPSPESRLGIFAAAAERLGEAGYHYLGMDHFALPDDELAKAAQERRLTRNFMGYTVKSGDALLAFGPSGISELPDCYAQAAHSPEDWASAIDGGELAIVRGRRLTEEDQRRRWLIRELLCNGTISTSGFEKHFGMALADEISDLEATLQPFLEDGLLEPVDDGYLVTPEGRFFLRPMAMSFDAYLPPEGAGPRRFSATV